MTIKQLQQMETTDIERVVDTFVDSNLEDKSNKFEYLRELIKENQ